MPHATARAFGLFGREAAVQGMQAVIAGGGSALAIGDPGVGKSSLLRVAAQLAQRHGARVLSVAPTPFDRGLPFAGLAELVAQCPEDAEAELPGPQRRALGIALQRLDPDGEAVDPLAVPLAVRSLLTQLRNAGQLTIILDDLQWLDLASAGTLAFAMRRLGDDSHRFGAVIGTRPEGIHSDLFRDLPQPHTDLLLPPLNETEVGLLLRGRLGPRWTPRTSAGVARASAGNPFLALMIAQAMQSDPSKWRWSAHDDHDRVLPVPSSLAEVLAEKIALLPHDAREILLLVSAAGRLTSTQLQRLVAPDRLRSALEIATDQDVAKVGADSVISFTHPMLASALYDAASPAACRRAHQLLADKLEDPVERARHRSLTTTTPDESVALELVAAAQTSLARGATAIAGDLFQAAAAATPSQAGDSTAVSRWLQAVDCYINTGDHDAASAALERCEALAFTDALKVQVLLRRHRLEPLASETRSLAERALRLAPAEAGTRAEILLDLGTAHTLEGHGRLAYRLTTRAIAEAVEGHRLDLQLAALQQRLRLERLFGLGQPHQSWHELQLLADDPALDESAAAFAWVRPWIHGFFADWDDPDAEKRIRDGISSLVEHGRYGYLSHLFGTLVLILIRQSRIHEARAALEEADRTAAWMPSLKAQEDVARILVNSYAGDLDVARELSENALRQEIIAGSAYWQATHMALVGFIEVSDRNWQTALDAFRQLTDIFVTTKMVDLEQLLWGVDYADAAIQLGALDEADAAIHILRIQGRSGRPEATIAADRCQALVTAARGDLDSALHSLVSLVNLKHVECPFEAARSHLALGQVYRRAGYRGMASEVLNEAADGFANLGIPRWAERARDEATRVGPQVTSTALTRTEQRVAEVVAAGRSNQEAAAELFMSVKTVEANLTRIYRKLAVRSRTELANRLRGDDSAEAVPRS